MVRGILRGRVGRGQALRPQGEDLWVRVAALELRAVRRGLVVLLGLLGAERLAAADGDEAVPRAAVLLVVPNVAVSSGINSTLIPAFWRSAWMSGMIAPEFAQVWS